MATSRCGAHGSCQSFAGSIEGPDKIVFQIGEEAFNQPFKSGPLIDQDGNFALFDILMNQADVRFHRR